MTASGLTITAETTPTFAIGDVVELALRVYGLTVSAAALPSERDQNFRLESRDGRRFVLKIAKSDEDHRVLELQNAVLRHVAAGAPRLATPRLMASRAGEDIARVEDSRGRAYFVRLITWLEGELWAQAAPHSPALLSSLGATLAELDRVLLDFAHPAMYRALYWDVKRADLALAHAALLPPAQQAAVEHCMRPWRELRWERLRHSLVHGDANDLNILVQGEAVAGLIDFGDIVHTATVCEPAIALAYAMQDQTDPLATGAAVLAGYHAHLPLTESEIEAVCPLVAARLCMSLCYAAYNARVKAGDEYQQVSAAPTWRLLQQLQELPPGRPLEIFREACR